MTKFFVLDVETANRSRASICQIGLAEFEHGICQDAANFLVNPEASFEDRNTKIHGLTSNHIAQSFTFPRMYPHLAEVFTGQVIASYSLFDQQALAQTIARYKLLPFSCQWVDIAEVARSTWPDLPKYGLKDILRHLGHSHPHHHDAAEDARAAGEILLHVLQLTGKPVTAFALSNPVHQAAKRSHRSTTRTTTYTVHITLQDTKPTKIKWE